VVSRSRHIRPKTEHLAHNPNKHHHPLSPSFPPLTYSKYLNVIPRSTAQSPTENRAAARHVLEVCNAPFTVRKERMVCPINSSTPACAKRGTRHPPPTSWMSDVLLVPVVVGEEEGEVEDEEGGEGALADEEEEEEEKEEGEEVAILVRMPVAVVGGVSK